MKQISFEEIGAVVATFQCDGAIDCGAVVAISDSGTVEGCSAGDSFCGVALADSSDVVAVQMGGFCTVAYSGTLAVGYKVLAADGDGGVKVVTSGGREMLVVSLDSTAGTAVVLL